MFSSNFIVFSDISSSWVFNIFCPTFFYYMFPIIFTSFLHRFLHHFLWFPVFSYLFNININPRILPVSFIFRFFLHHFLSLLLFSCTFTVFLSPPPLRGGVGGGLKTEIFHFRGRLPPPHTPRNISAKNFWFIMVFPGPG